LPNLFGPVRRPPPRRPAADCRRPGIRPPGTSWPRMPAAAGPTNMVADAGVAAQVHSAAPAPRPDPCPALRSHSMHPPPGTWDLQPGLWVQLRGRAAKPAGPPGTPPAPTACTDRYGHRATAPYRHHFAHTSGWSPTVTGHDGSSCPFPLTPVEGLFGDIASSMLLSVAAASVQGAGPVTAQTILRPTTSTL